MDGSSIAPDAIERHFWLTRSMARMVGVNLSRSLSSGQLTEADYCEMVARCRLSGCERRCERWLGQQAGRAAAPPEFCAHRDVLARLRP